jgi:1,2-diacylglycerol 3-alpha-glucosyltransferase
MHIAIIWQRFLPYHSARIRHLNKRLGELGFRLTAIEVASQDETYRFPEKRYNSPLKHICCFPGESYHSHTAKEVYQKVFELLKDVKPDIVFAPAIAFPEGIAAVAHRLKYGARVVIMDDAWEHTDRKGSITQLIKRLIYRNADAALVPAPSHLSYYMRIGFPKERVFFGLDVVDNAYYAKQAAVMHSEESVENALNLRHNLFLFVGRILPRKGLETLLEAYRNYREGAEGEIWDLVIVGTGSSLNALRSQFNKVGGICFAGAQFGDDLCKYYGLASVLIVPSDSDPWGLVVNEGMSSGLPVIVSKGCGAAKTLVADAENGWTFSPGNAEELSQLMLRVSSLSDDALKRMGQKSQTIIAEWSLDRFADGVVKALAIPRREAAGLISNILTKFWRGRIRVT